MFETTDYKLSKNRRRVIRDSRESNKVINQFDNIF